MKFTKDNGRGEDSLLKIMPFENAPSPMIFPTGFLLHLKFDFIVVICNACIHGENRS
jgi:hypothetical protein